jgi:transposase-like protein
MANKKKYSPKLAKQIAEFIAEDKHTISEICSLLSISRSVFYKWKDENRQLHSLVSRAEKIARLRKTEMLTSESKKSLLKLIKGFEITTEKHTTKYLEDGSKKEIWEYNTRFIDPDLKAILLVLKAKDSKNFKSRIKRIINVRFKAIYKEAEKLGRILSDDEPHPKDDWGNNTETDQQFKNHESKE